MTFNNLPALPALVQISFNLLQSLDKLGLLAEAELEWRIMTYKKEPGSSGEGSAVPQSNNLTQSLLVVRWSLQWALALL